MPVAENAPLGKLKVYLGYAAGVGKTFQMLADGQSAAQRGLDVVLAYFEPHARPDTLAQVQGLEIQPYRKINYRDRTFEEMDTEALLRRKPQIALVDELAHMNVPGSGRTKRWEDVQVLLNAGIEVLYDDRDESPGAKFAAMDLIGLPDQLIVGPRGVAAGTVECKNRRSGARQDRPIDAAVARLKRGRSPLVVRRDRRAAGPEKPNRAVA